MPAPEPEPCWQLVLVLWGTKYPVAEVNALILTIRRLARPAPSRIVLLTDRRRSGLLPDVEMREMPQFYQNPELQKGGCQAKLCMFEEGLVPADLPAIFVDIDTVVLGNLALLLGVLDCPDQMAILQSAILPFGAFARFLHRVSGGRRYARGNSSIVVYHPAHTAHISRAYRRLFALRGHNGLHPMVADERFMSWANQLKIRAIPSKMAVKFPTEFMLPWRGLIYLRALMPWVRRRRAGLLAVTLPGFEVKGEALVAMAEGDEIVDRKGRRLIWSDRALGSMRGKLIDYYSALRRSKA